MSGSGASNLGYENVNPYNTSSYVNGTSSNYSGNFSSNEIPGTPPGPLPGLAGAKSNVDAAAGKVPGICVQEGGSKKLRRKIKNITKHYKRMKTRSKNVYRLKSMLRKRAASRTLSRRLVRGRRRSISRKRSRSFASGRRRRQHGGYAQYQNNMPMTPTYQISGINLPASQLALANPPPITPLSNCVNCVDNYSHFPPPSGYGFPSKGH